MKLSRTSWLILTSGIFIVTLASLGIAHSQQLEEQELLGDNLSVAELRLGKLQTKELTSQREELEAQLSQATSQLETAKEDMRQPIESIDVTDSLFEIAEACYVTVIDISSSGSTTEKLAGIGCSALALTVRVEGDVPNLIDFVIKLNNDFTTGAVKSADIAIPETTDEKETRPSARIQLVVYAYQGD